MAENEVLDVGNPRRFRRWRTALADADLDPAAVAECLYEDFSVVLRNKLRRKPLYLVLKACDSGREALQLAIDNLKDRALAKLVEQAHSITRSNDPQIVAGKITELLIDRLVGRANRYAFKHNPDSVRQAALENAAYVRLEACRAEIIGVLTASLRDEPIRRVRRAATVRPSAESLLSTSLLQQDRKQPGEVPHV